MKKSVLLLWALLAVVFTASPAWGASKSQQVEKYLGKYRFENDRPVGTVKFIFQKAVFKRVADGKKSYKYLLFDVPNYSNEDNAGKLIGIQVLHRGRTTTILPESPDKDNDVAEEPSSVPPPKKEKRKQQPTNAQPAPAKPEPSAMAGDETGDLLKPIPVNDPVRPRKDYAALALPDSMALAANITDAKESITTWKARMWQTIKPLWEFCMWVFNSAVVLLICFGGLCRYVARTAASESRMDNYGRILVGRWIVSAHQNAAAMLLVVTWMVAIVLLIDVFMWLVYLDLSVWLLVVIWFPILWAAEKLTSWIVPNIPVLGAGH